MLISESVHHGDVLINAIVIEVPEGSSGERSESGTEDEANVSLDGVLNDLILEAHDGLVDEPTYDPILHVKLSETKVTSLELWRAKW